MPLTSVTSDAERLTLTVVGDYLVPQQRLWDAFADPRQLERFWGPPTWPATFTRHEFQVGGRAEYFLTGPNGEKWSGSWKFTAVNPISSFEAQDGDDNADDEAMPSSMTFTFETTPTGSRMTCITRFSSIEAMEQTSVGMEQGLRAAMPQLDALLAEYHHPSLPISRGPTMSNTTTFNATTLGCSLTCKEIDTSIRFYRDVLGFAVDMTFEHEGRMAGAVISAGDIRIVLNQDDGKLGWDRIKGQGFYLQINVAGAADVDAAAQRIKAAGGTLIDEPEDRPWGARMFQFRDPDGFKLGVSTPLSAASSHELGDADLEKVSGGIGMLLPAVQKVRDTAVRTSSISTESISFSHEKIVK